MQVCVIKRFAENGFDIHPMALDMFVYRTVQLTGKSYQCNSKFLDFIDYFCGWLELKGISFVTVNDVELFFKELRRVLEFV